MALQTTGQISHSEIMAEFSVAAGQFKLSTDGGVLLQGVGDPKAPGDMIKESDFYGVSAESPGLDEYFTQQADYYDNSGSSTTTAAACNYFYGQPTAAAGFGQAQNPHYGTLGAYSNDPTAIAGNEPEWNLGAAVYDGAGPTTAHQGYVGRVYAQQRTKIPAFSEAMRIQGGRRGWFNGGKTQTTTKTPLFRYVSPFQKINPGSKQFYGQYYIEASSRDFINGTSSYQLWLLEYNDIEPHPNDSGRMVLKNRISRTRLLNKSCDSNNPLTVVDRRFINTSQQQWTFNKVTTGKYLSLELYGTMTNQHGNNCYISAGVRNL